MVLPICTEHNLLALLKIEIVLSDEDADKVSTVQDVKALMAAIQSEVQKSLVQVVFA